VKHIAKEVLSQVPLLIPGIEQVILIQMDQSNDVLAGEILKKRDDGYFTEPVKIESGNDFFIKQLHGSLHYKWFSKNEIPFEIEPNVKVQLSIFNELKYSVLLIIINITETAFSNFYFFYFNENLSNFLLDKVSEQFSAQHKNMVGFLIYHAVHAFFRIYTHHEQVIFTFNTQVLAIIKERDNLKEEIGKIYGKERHEILRMAQHYLNKIAKESGRAAILSDSAKTKLRDFTGELFELDSVMRDAMTFAGALSLSKGVSPIILADYHLRFPEPASPSLPANMEGLPQRYIKTHLLLDRLELAATGLKQRKIPLTSSNVGKEFPTPVSAPAITDALKKHKKRIFSLFEQYPEKWETIRHEFRPIQNLFIAHTNSAQLSA